VQEGLKRSGRSMDDFEISYTPFLISGKDEESFETNKTNTRNRIAFYGSTPAYKQVLGIHGWGDLQPELNSMSKQGKWKEMGELVTDEMLNTFGVMGEPDTLVDEIKRRFSDISDRMDGGFHFVDSDTRREMVARLRA
jgi:alkanesulfonate monooxygenase SsuD/methylene tetrahydromethanopterin reductase-like flavin-dependent oxidoreductase (luciferase family)